MQEEYQMYKIVVVGNTGTGKTNISTRYVRDQFMEVSNATLGVEFLTKIVEVNGKRIKIAIWDTAGQQQYRALSKIYYKGASGVIIVYDITDARSYLQLESWMRLVNQILDVDDIILMVVGNKLDREDEREVPKQRPIQEFQEVFGIDCWQVSAKKNIKIQQLFSDMVDKILQKANDVKDTVYKGTAEYESERGTYIKGKSEIKNVGYHQNNNKSVIVEEEEDIKSIDVSRMRAVKNKPVEGSSMVLTLVQYTQDMQHKSKKKCC